MTILIPNKKLLMPARDLHVGFGHELEQRIRMVARKVNAHGDIIHSRDVADFPNLITDYGLNYFGSNSGAAAYCQVGTGTTTPTFGDTALVARVASSNTEDSSNRSQQIVVGPPRFASAVSMRRFAAGTPGIAGAALAEVGFGNVAVGNLWNRALIRDGGGSPTTITIAADEILDVYLETRLYIPTGDGTPQVLNLGGVDYTFTRRVIRNSNMRSIGGSTEGWGLHNAPSSMTQPLLGGGTGFGTGAQRGSSAYNGAITTENGVEPSGTADGAAATNSSYVNGTYQKDGSLIWDITRGNLAGGISAMTVTTQMSAWQYSISPPIPKTSSQSLSINVRQTWARR